MGLKDALTVGSYYLSNVTIAGGFVSGPESYEYF